MIEVVIYAQILVWLIVIGVFLASGQASLFHPATWYLAFHGLVFVVRPMLVYFLNFDHEFIYMGIPPDDGLLIKTMIITSVGLIVFVGCAVGFGWTAPHFRLSVPEPFTPEQMRGLKWLTVLMLPVIAYSIHAGQADFATEEHGGTYVMVGASGYAIEAQLMAGPLLCLWLAATRFRWPVLLLLGPYVIYRAYAGMSRWSFVLLFAALGLMYTWQNRRKWVPWWLVLCALPVFPLFKAIGDDRVLVKELLQGHYNREALDKTEIGMSSTDRFRAKYDGPDFANFDFLCFVVEMVPDRTETYTYASQYLQLFTEPIPRKLWPGKPAGAPIGFFNLNNYGDFLGRTPSLIGDGWMSGGWIGMILTMGIVGALLGKAHRWFWSRPDNNVVALFYLVSLAMLPQWFRDGGISISKFLFWNLAPLCAWLGIIWLLGNRLLPAYSVVLPAGSRIKVAPESQPVTGHARN